MSITKKDSSRRTGKTKKLPAKKRTPRKRLAVVLDTNALHTDSSAYFVRMELKALVLECQAHSEVEIKWHIPEVVVDERRFQMAKRALTLEGKVSEYSRLLGIEIACTPEQIERHVQHRVEEEMRDLELDMATINPASVDWKQIQQAACFRIEPFEDVAKNEKGFRDSLILETASQLVDDLATTWTIAFISNDGALNSGARTRFSSNSRVRIYEDLAQLRGLINTFVENVSESVVKEAAEKCYLAFFDFTNQNDESKFWHKLELESKLGEQFRKGLESENLVRISNKSYTLLKPTLVEKKGATWTWSTRIVRVDHCRESVFDPSSGPPGSSVGIVSLGGPGGSQEFELDLTPEKSGLTGGSVPTNEPVSTLFGSYRHTDYEFTQEVDAIWRVTIASNGVLRGPKFVELRLVKTNKKLLLP